MASLRDAMKRLQVIYEDCNPEMVEKAKEEQNWDDFTKLKKKIHGDVKAARIALKEREELFALKGTTQETAEASYRIRVMIKALKEQATQLKEIVDKEERKKSLKIPVEEVRRRKEIVDLVHKHIDEVEQLEKRRFNDKVSTDRALLLSPPGGGPADGNPFKKSGGASGGMAGAGGAGGSGGGGGGNGSKSGSGEYLSTELPDIDVDEDLKFLQLKNNAIDKQMEAISSGVTKLKEIALDMNQELDRQDGALTEVDQDVEKALDHLDSTNVNMKKALDGVMKGDRFIINCILFCILLGLIAYITSQAVQ